MTESYETDSEEELASAAAIFVLCSGYHLKCHFRDEIRKNMTAEDLEFEKMLILKRKKRRFWVDPLFRNRERSKASVMLKTFLREPSVTYENLCRMLATDFECLLNKIGPHIEKKETCMRKSVSIQERLAMTLQFLATGNSLKSLQEDFRCSTNTLSRGIEDVCKALVQELGEEIKLPKNEDEWLSIAQGYQNQWNFPNCVGVIDSKLILVSTPGHTLSKNLLNEGVVHLVLQALVDARYCFTYVDIISKPVSDGEVLCHPSSFLHQECGQLNLPSDEPLPSCSTKVPYVFLVDSDYPLSRHKLNPYPGILPKGSAQSVFNYRHSRARRVVENAFGILSSVFRVFRKPMVFDMEKNKNIILTCILLHNFLRRNPTSASSYTPLGTFDAEIDGEIIPGSWRNDHSDMLSFKSLKKVNVKSEEEAEDIRDCFADYFVTKDKLPNQDK